MPVWKAIATRQLQSRLVNEAERRRLRQVVATRSKLLQELGEKVEQQLQGAATDGSDAAAAGQSVPPVGPEDTALFERYVQELDVAYEQVDNILEA
ncbi:hypothetical protein PHYPSEUDO_002662 [Phytophthora pseudosyringae]|uniref:Uncharacterized protein n=1 Tax=Phytophthora pseudosyringae TaxID=221518 RepID=A0A8T1V1N9_9STRA|nr:hypothetical protein PHYPSEUDO_002662 [Phytophthora pseudosyringae]